MYGYTYVPREEPDSLSADSILLLEEDGQPIEPSEAGAEISSEQASQSGKSRQGVTARDKRNNRRNGGDEPNPEEYYE